MNFAGVRRLPVVFVIDNNQFAYSTPTHLNFASSSLAARGPAYGFEGVVVDGTDVLAVYREARAAIERARSGGGPTALELMTLRMEGHAVHDDAAYVPPEHARALGRVGSRAAASRPGCASTASWATTSSPTLERGVEDAIGEAVARAEASAWPDPGHARGWRLRRLRRSGGQPPLSLPRYRPWFYDLVRDRERHVPAPVFRLSATGVENVPARGRRRARADASLVRRHARRRRAAEDSVASVRWPSTSCSSCPWSGARSRSAGGSRCAARVQDMEAYEDGAAPAARGRHAARLPRGHAQPRRLGATAAGRGAARARGRGGASCPSRSAAATASSSCRRASRRSGCTTASRSRSDDLPADDLRRASYTATKRWSEAIDAGLATLPH